MSLSVVSDFEQKRENAPYVTKNLVGCAYLILGYRRLTTAGGRLIQNHRKSEVKLRCHNEKTTGV